MAVELGEPGIDQQRRFEVSGTDEAVAMLQHFLGESVVAAVQAEPVQPQGPVNEFYDGPVVNHHNLGTTG